MPRKFRYVIVITGDLPARNRAQAYNIVRMGFTLVARLLESPNDIAIRIEEITEEAPEEDKGLALQLFRKQFRKQ